MRSALPALVGMIAVATACGGEVGGTRGSGFGARSTEPPAQGVDAGGGAGPAAAVSDAGASRAPASTTVGSVQYDCLTGDVGPSSPELFADLHYTRQACAGPGSDCVDFLVVQADCSVSLQVRNVTHDATLEPADCAALARWATSEVLARGLDDLQACSPGGGNPPEMTEVGLTSGPGPRKKTGLCPDEPYASHRACMAQVRARYFPGL